MSRPPKPVPTATAVDDDWPAGLVGLFRGDTSGSTTHEFDDFKIGYDNNGDGDFDDVGDVMAVSDDFSSNVMTLAYDANGNLTDDGIRVFKYDAWNRLVKALLKVGAAETVFAVYEYYGSTRRAVKTVSNRGAEIYPNDGGDAEVRFYYDSQWRILETRNGSGQTTFQHLWGTRYVDEIVWIERNGDPSIGSDTTSSRPRMRATLCIRIGIETLRR